MACNLVRFIEMRRLCFFSLICKAFFKFNDCKIVEVFEGPKVLKNGIIEPNVFRLEWIG
jgi:hypothetical protein